MQTLTPHIPTRTSFLLRRAHSLSGIFPIGIYTVFHLNANASVVWSELLFKLGLSSRNGIQTYQHEVDFIHTLPALPLIELFGIWIPILFHAIFGIYIARSGSTRTTTAPFNSNLRYKLQRLTGYIGFVFLLHHVLTLRFGIEWIPFSHAFDAHNAASSTALALRGGDPAIFNLAGILTGVIYLAGTTALVFHLANGAWTFAITWGITVSEASQRRCAQICTAAGLILLTLGWAGFFGLVLHSPTPSTPPSKPTPAPPAVHTSSSTQPVLMTCPMRADHSHAYA